MNNRIKSSISTNTRQQFTEQLQLYNQTSSLGYSEPLSPKQVSDVFFMENYHTQLFFILPKLANFPSTKLDRNILPG